MGTEIEIHQVQAQILRVLLFKPAARFSELNVTKITTDHFSFHMKQLLSSELIRKTGDGRYSLTPKGKEFANRFDTEKVNIERQAKLGVLVIGVKKERGRTKYLVQQRLKQPYYGYYGFTTGKMRWGEKAMETAAREFKEETNLNGQLAIKGIEHKMDYSPDGRLLEDKFFYVFRAEKTKGKLREKFEGGRNKWLTKKEIFGLKDLFSDVKFLLKIVESKKFIFSEVKYKVSSY